MAILASDIKFLQSERMTDLDDAGGFATNNEVLDNIDNNVFPDISSGDHVTGFTELRLIYGAVRSSDTDTFFSARVYIASPPAETGVTSFLFPASTGEVRTEYVQELYRYANQGANTNYRLFTTYGSGSNPIRLYFANTYQSAKPTVSPMIGEKYILEDTSEGSYQVITVQGYTIGGGPDYTSILMELTEPLTATFNGALYTDADHIDYATPTQMYLVDSLPIRVYGLDTVANQGEVDDTTIVVSSNNLALAPLINYVESVTGQHAGIQGGDLYFVQVATADTQRTHVLPVSGSYTTLWRVEYLLDGEWQIYPVSLYTTSGSFIVTLPDIPDSGSDVVYYTEAATPITTLTALTFRLQPGIVASSIALTGINAVGTAVSAVDDGVGGWTGADVSSGSVDYTTGLCEVVMATACNPGEIFVDYQYTTLAESGLAVGVDLAQLPPSKSAPIFRQGDSVLIHHTTSEALTNPVVASTTYTLSRSNVDQIWLEAANGTRIPTAQYTVDLTAGEVTMIAGLDLTGYQQPLNAYTTLQDEAVILGVDGTTLQLNRALTHTYPADDSYVSSILQCGDLFAYVTAPFAQQAWTSVWSDTLIGTVISPQFDNVTYPIVVTNDGAITDRWRIQFTAATTVNVIGEKIGQIATDLSITSEIAPINPYTLQPYFTIPYEGWGAGWVNGNLLRFNTTGAEQAIGVGRSIQPGDHSIGTSDRFRLTLLGDVDA